MSKKTQWVKCPNPGMGCHECPHRLKHKFDKEKCTDNCSGYTCIPNDPTMERIILVDTKTTRGILYQCPTCKRIEAAGNKPPKCKECM
jgi:hypothetical protein